MHISLNRSMKETVLYFVLYPQFFRSFIWFLADSILSVSVKVSYLLKKSLYCISFTTELPILTVFSISFIPLIISNLIFSYRCIIIPRFGYNIIPYTILFFVYSI